MDWRILFVVVVSGASQNSNDQRLKMIKYSNPSHFRNVARAADVSISLAFSFPRSSCEIAKISGKYSSKVLTDCFGCVFFQFFM